jgi:hypothetical protein
MIRTNRGKTGEVKGQRGFKPIIAFGTIWAVMCKCALKIKANKTRDKGGG